MAETTGGNDANPRIAVPGCHSAADRTTEVKTATNRRLIGRKECVLHDRNRGYRLIVHDAAVDKSKRMRDSFSATGPFRQDLHRRGVEACICGRPENVLA